MKNTNGKNFAFMSQGIEYFDHEGWQQFVSDAAKNITGLRLVDPLSAEELLQLGKLRFPRLQALAINFDPQSKSIKPLSFSLTAPLLENLTLPYGPHIGTWSEANPGLKGKIMGQSS